MQTFKINLIFVHRALANYLPLSIPTVWVIPDWLFEFNNQTLIFSLIKLAAYYVKGSREHNSVQVAFPEMVERFEGANFLSQSKRGQQSFTFIIP